MKQAWTDIFKREPTFFMRERISLKNRPKKHWFFVFFILFEKKRKFGDWERFDPVCALLSLSWAYAGLIEGCVEAVIGMWGCLFQSQPRLIGLKLILTTMSDQSGQLRVRPKAPYDIENKRYWGGPLKGLTPQTSMQQSVWIEIPHSSFNKWIWSRVRWKLTLVEMYWDGSHNPIAFN